MESKEKFVIQSLSSLLDNGLSEDILVPIFKTFSTKKDKDVEKFLVEKAIGYEKNGAGRTWLVMDGASKNHILGYFTIGLNTLYYKDGIEDVEKAYPGLNLYNDKYLPVYVLFLIGKNDSCPKGISMGKIFEKYGLTFIREAKSRVGGSILYIDCVKELVDYYKGLGFEHFDSHVIDDPDEGEVTLNTMIRSI